MQNKFVITFDNGLPKGTAQQKGEGIRYKRVSGKLVPYIQHYKTEKVAAMRKEFEWRLKSHAPAKPMTGPVKLFVLVCFSVKDKKLWGTYKTTRPDGDNYLKELKDALGTCGFFLDDAQIVDERIVRVYSEQASITIQIEDIPQPRRIKT